MAFKKPLRFITTPSDTTGDAIDVIKNVFEQFKVAFDEYVGDLGSATIVDREVSGTRVVDIIFGVNGCNYGWTLSANVVNATSVRVYYSQINKNDYTVVNTIYNALFDKTGLSDTSRYRNALYCIASNKSFVINPYPSISLAESEKLTLTNSYVYGIVPTKDNNYIMVVNSIMGGYLAGSNAILNVTLPSVISQLPGTCVVRRVLYTNNKELDDDIWLFNSARGPANLRDWYLSLKNSGVYYAIGTTGLSIFKINEDARSVSR